MYVSLFLVIVGLVSSSFIVVQTFPRMCIYPVVSPFADRMMIEDISNSSCLNRCMSDESCNYVSYYNNSCLLATSMELTDNFNRSQLYFSRGTITYKRITSPAIRYISQRCNVYFDRRQCNLDPQCGWNRGFAGINRESYGMGSNWCGRIKCGSNN